MNKSKSAIGYILICIMAAGLAGCAAFEKCTPENCATDAQIKKDVDAMLTEHREFGPPGVFHVQIINGVVYMNGIVNSELEMRSTESLVRQVSQRQGRREQLERAQQRPLARPRALRAPLRSASSSVVPESGALLMVNSAPMSCACSRRPINPK